MGKKSSESARQGVAVMNAEEFRRERAFEAVFEDAPVAIWYEDFSAIRTFLCELQAKGIDDLPTFLEQAPDTVIECVRRVRVRHINRVAREFYGAETREQIAELLPSLFDQAALDTFRNEIIAFLKGARSFVAEVGAATLSGDSRLVQMNVSLLSTAPEDWSEVVVTFTDLTNRRDLEQSLRRANESLRRSNEDMEQFAYTVSHDLQEPLRIISGYVALLTRRFGGSIDPNEMEFFGYITDATARMQAMINEILTFSRLTRADAVAQWVDLNAVLTWARRNLSAVMDESGAELICGSLPTVEGDFNQLASVFQNLISNAIKYRGTETPRIAISAVSDQAEWTISVCDNGCGIDPKNHDRIFAFFKRLHSASQIPGTGIGLAIVKRIVERHGGRVWVQSKVGEGATFTFTLPLKSL